MDASLNKRSIHDHIQIMNITEVIELIGIITS